MYQIEGRNPVIESLRSDHKPREILLEQSINIDNKIQEILDTATKYSIPVKRIGLKLMNKRSQTGHHQGVIAISSRDNDSQTLPQLLKELKKERKDPFLIIIRETLYEYNLGAIIRTAECTGAHAVIVTPKTNVSAQVVRASMGASEHIPIIKSSFFQSLKLLKKEGIAICAIEINSRTYYWEEDLTGPIAFIIGGEDRSLTDTIQEKADKSVKIPLHGHVNSLNMSVAAGIILFEKVHQEALLA